MMKTKIKNHIQQIRGIAYGGNDSIDSPKENYIPVLRSNNIKEGSLTLDDLVYIPSRLVKQNQLIKKGDIVITASTGSLKVIGKNGAAKHDYQASFGAFCKVVRPLKTINADYLKHFFQSDIYRKKIQSLVNGANINNIKNEHLDELELYVPDLPTQQKIAALLDKADELRQYNKQLIEKYDALTQSLFLDMFGDPVKNEKGWEKVRFDELVSKECPLTYGIVQPGEEFVNGVPCVRPVDLITQYITVNSLKKIDPKISSKFHRTLLKGGELLLSVRGSVGVISVADETLKGSNVTRGIVPIWFESNISNKIFFYYLYRTMEVQREIKSLAKGATLIQINLKDLREVKMIKPPIALQNQFAERVQLIEQQKELAQQALQKSEGLFNSLLQKAFKGELVEEYEL